MTRFREEGVRIHRHDNTDSDVLGLGYTSHSVTAHCLAAKPNFMSMVRVTDTTTGVTGYALLDMLRDVPEGLPGC